MHAGSAAQIERPLVATPLEPVVLDLRCGFHRGMCPGIARRGELLPRPGNPDRFRAPFATTAAVARCSRSKSFETQARPTVNPITILWRTPDDTHDT